MYEDERIVRRQIQCFLKTLYQNKFTFQDFLTGNCLCSSVFRQFFFRLQYVIGDGGRSETYSFQEDSWVLYDEKEKGQTDNRVTWQRCIGKFPCRDSSGHEESVLKVYYCLEIDGSGTDTVFLHCAEEVYAKWISEVIATGMRSEEEQPDALVSREGMRLYRDLHLQLALAFQRYMRKVYDIDAEAVTTLSGIYYERESCRSCLAFWVGDQKNACFSDGITFSCPIAFERNNLKKIRKLLQMGQEGQCLLVCKQPETTTSKTATSKAQWVIKGLYNLENFSNQAITFRIISHMVWDMEVGGRYAVSYKFGNYEVEDREGELERLKSKYRAIFGREPEQNVRTIFKKAISQEHGTILVILKRDGKLSAKQEVMRLIETSAGTSVEAGELPEEFVISLTSIDGALMIDEKGVCYGFGIILDGDQTKGDPGRGARYNSTKKYIKMCKNREMKAIGVVVSEDKNITIFSTEDDLDGEGA